MAIKIQGTTVIDDSRNATNLGDITASGDVNFTGSGSFKVPSGTTAQRPASPSVGEIRYNTDNSEFEQYDGSGWVALSPPIDKGTLDKTFATGESATITLSEEVTTAPVVSVIKEVPQTGITNNDWDVASDGANYTLHDTAYDTTLTPDEIGYISVQDWSYDNISLDTSGETAQAKGVTLNNDGSKVYVVDENSSAIYQYSLSTPFSLGTGSYDNVSFSVSSQASQPQGCEFNDDGSKMYVIDQGTDRIYQYSLSTSFDLGTASYDNVEFDVGSQDTSPRTLEFNNDGTKLFIGGNGSDTVYQYTLSTAYDLNTISYDNVSLNVSNNVSAVKGLTFNSDGTKLYVVQDDVYQYSLSTAFDVSTASYDNETFDFAFSGNSMSGVSDIEFIDNGTKVFISEAGDNRIYQYSTSKEGLVLGTGSFASTDVGKRIVGNGGEAILTAADGSYELQTAFNDTSTIAAGDWSMFGLDVESGDAGLTLSGLVLGLADASYDSVNFSVSSRGVAPSGITFNNDGTKMYTVDQGNDTVFQYSLSTAFDLSTASYNSVLFSVETEESQPTGVVFSSDGTKMYVIGLNTDSVYQYSLSTGFDLSTASYDSVSFSVSSQETSPHGIAFNSDGTKMYVVGPSTVYQYSLSTAFDLSSASYDTVSFSVNSQDYSSRGMAFNSDGTKLYVVGRQNDSVYQYSLSTAFDLSTASYDSVSFSVASEDTSPTGIAFNSDNTKMYILGDATDSVYQYTTSLFVLPTSANHTAITSASTNTEYWTDINSMTADDSVNDGAVYYAVSTDDRTTWSIIDDTNGVRNIVRDNAGTWEVNDASDYGTETWVAASENDEFYALEEAVDVSTAQSIVGFIPADQWSYDSVSFDVSAQEGAATSVKFNNTGNKLYIVGGNNDSIHQYSLSTSFDLSTASYDNVSLDVSSRGGSPAAIEFNDTGSKLYLLEYSNQILYQYTLATPFNLSTASYDSVSFDVSSQDSDPSELTFSNDGTKLFMIGDGNDAVYQYSLSNSFEISTASYDNINLNVSSEDDGAGGIAFSNDGSTLYISGYGSDKVHQYTLTTPFDLSTVSYDNIFFDMSSEENNVSGITFNNDGNKIYMIGSGSDKINQYTTGSTTSTNRMDAAQLNAVSDANHYTLGNDLDLAITLFMADGNTNSPTSDGVSINYDANVLNQGAVLGTDYEFDKPANDKVRITALSDENFKVKVI